MKTFEKPSLEIADIFNRFDHLLGPLPRAQRKVIDAIKTCRTEAMGGHKLKCNECDFEKQAYNSCRNRHCPKCQFLARAKWIEKRTEDLLPCPYFHIVFTLPAELRLLVLRNQKVCYDALFRAASETIKEVAKNPKHLGADIGCIGVLHTWAQNLVDHPHVHFIVPGGGLSADGKRWLTSSDGFFAPIAILSKVFRGKFLGLIESAYYEGKFEFFGDLKSIETPHMFQGLLIQCASKPFVVYAKEPFSGPKQVINYLGQYTHRIAISNYRLVELTGEMVTFKVRDRKDQKSKKQLTLHVKEFMRRFLLHVLPRGYVRIRHYGILGSRAKKTKLVIIQTLLGVTKQAVDAIKETWQDLLKRTTGIDVNVCPVCKQGTMVDELKATAMKNTG
jgi:hypothetical protein